MALMDGGGRDSRAAGRYARKKLAMLMARGLLPQMGGRPPGMMSDDQAAAMWREQSKNPYAWQQPNMGMGMAQQQGMGRGQIGTPEEPGMQPGQQPYAPQLGGARGFTLGQEGIQGLDPEQLRAELLGQMGMAAQIMPQPGIGEIANKFRMNAGGIPGKRRLQHVAGAQSRAQQLAQIMARRLRNGM